jgi:hypothetical protein
LQGPGSETGIDQKIFGDGISLRAWLTRHTNEEHPMDAPIVVP